MAFILRKGSSSIYFQYETTGESIGVVETEVEIVNRDLVFRCKVSPVDSNQKMDEDHLHEMELKSITLGDDYMITKFVEFCENKIISAFKVEILSRGKHLVFNVSEGPSKINGLTFSFESKNS